MVSTKQDDDLFEGTKMTFGEHLEELRICFVKGLLGLAVGMVFGFYLADDVVRHIQGPLEVALQDFYKNKTQNRLKSEYGAIPQDINEYIDANRLVYEDTYIELKQLHEIAGAVQGGSGEAKSSDAAPSDTDIVWNLKQGPPTAPLVRMRVWKQIDAEITSLSAHEPFMIWMKAALITGAVIASPWIFWQLWAFVAAGLYPHEKGLVYFFLPVSLGLFFAGALLAFFFVFKPVLSFLFEFNAAMNIDPDPRISEWMSFVLLLPLGFGVSFQLPLVMLIVHRLGIVSIEAYLEKWRIAILAIFVVSMVLTPADPISMLLMAVPLSFLYFGGILLCRYLPRRKSPYGEGFDPV